MMKNSALMQNPQLIAEIEMDPELEKELEFGASENIMNSQDPGMASHYHKQQIGISNLMHPLSMNNKLDDDPSNIPAENVSPMSQQRRSPYTPQQEHLHGPHSATLQNNYLNS